MSGFRQILPDAAEYRRELVALGAPQPLPRVPAPAGGLLEALPRAERHGWPWDVQTPPRQVDPSAWPLITLVTPSYQQGEFIEETLRSVLLQNYPCLEYVVLDGGSTDASPAVIECYRPWLSYARSARDRGQAHAINLGFSLGSGQIFAWLNSDDFLLPGALWRVAEAYRGGAEFIYGDGLECDATTGIWHYSTANYAWARYVRYPGLVLSHATFWSAAKHQPVWEEQHCAIDYELWVRLLPGLRTKHIGWPLAVARRHPAAKTHDVKMLARWEADASRNYAAHPELYSSSPWLDREHRIVQRVTRAWRRRGLAARLDRVRRECGWDFPISIA